VSKPHPFRFGHFANGSSRAEWAETARKAEAAGFSTLQVGDHLMQELGPFPALAAAAAVTTTLRLGTHVLGNDFYNPIMLARDAASVDILSDGRLELGLGSGWRAADYIQSGIALDAPGVRVSRLEEGLRVIKGALGEPPFSFAGRYYMLREVQGVPRPVQRPLPPLLVGGGARRTLSIAAREADIVGINAKTTADGDIDVTSLTAEATDEKVAWVREAAGERFAELELNILLLLVRVTDDPRGAIEETLRRFGVPPELVGVETALQSPAFLVGSLEQIVETLQERRERYGISYISSWEPIEELTPIIARLAGQ